MKALALAAAVAGGVVPAVVSIDLPARGTILFVGDSVTWQNHYVAFVGAALIRARPEGSLRIVNRGVRGDTARDVLARVDRDVVPEHPRLIFVMLGVNDGGLRGKSGRLLAAYERNMGRLVGILRAKTKAQVVLITPTPVAASDPGLREYNEMLATMSAHLLALGRRLGVATVDVFTPLRAAREHAAAVGAQIPLMADALHPNLAGHLIIAQEILAQLMAPAATETVIGADVCGETPVAVPLAHDHRNVYLPPAARPALDLLPASRRPTVHLLRVPGVTCAVRLSVDGEDLGSFSAQELVRRIDLDRLDAAPWVRDARRDYERMVEKWRWFYAAWDPRDLGSEAILQVGGPAVHGTGDQVRAFARRRLGELDAELAAGRSGGPVVYTLRFVRVSPRVSRRASPR